MTIARFIRLFKERFTAEISKKTGWGKNELISVMTKLTDDLIFEVLEEKEK